MNDMSGGILFEEHSFVSFLLLQMDFYYNFFRREVTVFQSVSFYFSSFFRCFLFSYFLLIRICGDQKKA